ncbi:MAG: SoxR reducing system RseC family protein [Candidatus Cloacimonetes bacterium]|nr:SoxR reducing system RseC family protein [Candidatus Cloacimonadota bacterium]
MENIEDTAIVKEIRNDYILIEMVKTTSCDNCGLRMLCHGNDKNIVHKIKTNMKLNIGDTVMVAVSPGIRILSSFIVFIYPILSMIFFYVIGKFLLNFNENFSILSSFLGLLLSGIIIYFFDKKYGNKIKFEILKKIEK